MQLLPTAEVLAWTDSHGIGWDPRYPEGHQLSYLAAPGNWRTWEPPPGPGELAWFAHLVLTTAAAGGPLLLFPRFDGYWCTKGGDDRWEAVALDVVMRGAEVPRNFAGGVWFEPPEIGVATAVAIGSLVFGWSTSGDVYILPRDACCILMTSHHREIYGAFRSPEDRERFTAALVAGGYADLDAEEP